MGRVLSRMVMTEYKNCRKAKASGKDLSSKRRITCDRHSGFHLFERILVANASFVGR
jgi:hypothetical protein